MARTLNDIVPPSRRRTMEGGMGQTPPSSAPAPRAPRRGGFPYGTLIVALIVIALAVGALFYFSGARVNVTPKTYVATVDADLSATPNEGDLPYKVVSIDKVASKSVKAESTVQANDSASGSIVISNAQTKPQQLITNTRFESPAGLIYRIHAPITVPAGGSLTVDVFADQPGETYNIEATTFTLPGLKGTPTFTQVTAKSSAAMTGGFKGQRPSVGEATKKSTLTALESGLAGELNSALAAALPAGYILMPSTISTKYVPQNDTAGEGGTVTISEKGTTSGIALPKDALAKAIAYKAVSLYAGEPVTLAATDGLTLSGTGSSTPSGAAPMNFHLAGSATLIWKVDAAKVAGAVAGKKRDSAQAVLLGFPEIDKAVLVLKPFFAGSYPDDPAKIQITVEDPTKPKK